MHQGLEILEPGNAARFKKLEQEVQDILLVRSQGEKRLQCIGEEVNQIGGLGLMTKLYYDLSKQPNLRGVSTDVNYLWDGVGAWVY